jgi:hypothetical protein
VVPAMVNVRGPQFVIPDSMSRTGEESDEQTRAYRRALLLEGPLEGRTLVELAPIEGMPDCPYKNVEAAKAWHEKIGDRTIPAPGGSNSMRQQPLSFDTYHNRGPP